MANVTGQQEKAVRDAIRAQILKYSEMPNVFTRRRFITSRQDFFAKLGKKGADQKTKIQFAEIAFLGFSDGDGGFEETPEIDLKYQIHLFVEFDDGTDNDNSTDRFIALILDLRNEFLLNKTFAGGKATDGFAPDTFAQFGADTFTDVDGHFIDLRLVVTHKATC